MRIVALCTCALATAHAFQLPFAQSHFANCNLAPLSAGPARSATTSQTGFCSRPRAARSRASVHGRGAAIRCGSDGSSEGEEAPAEPYTIVSDIQHEELRRWASEAGVRCGSWDIALFPELEVRGAVALADIPAGQALVSVPLSAGITLDAQSACPFPPEFADKEAWDASPRWQFQMALHLFWQRCQGQDSPRSRFIASMPSACDTLRKYPNTLLQELQDDMLISRVLDWRRACAAEWDRLSPLLSPACPLGQDEYLWAVDMVSSRTFCVDGAGRGGSKLYGMYPMADMFNHEFGNTEFRVVGAGGGDPRFEIVCGENVRAGDQVMISYGAIDNGWLLQSYGFGIAMHAPSNVHARIHLCTRARSAARHTLTHRFVDEGNGMDAVGFTKDELNEAAERVMGGSFLALSQKTCEALLPGFVASVQGSGDGGRLNVYRSGEEEALMVYLRALLLTSEDLQTDSTGEAGGGGGPDARVVGGEDGAGLKRLLAGSAVSLENECRVWCVHKFRCTCV